jgi:hypothetical protein
MHRHNPEGALMPPKPKTRLHDVEAFLRDLRAGNVDRRKALIHYHVGNDFTGFTDLEILGNGDARLKSTVTRGLNLVWTGSSVDDTSLDHLLRTLISTKIWLIKGTRMEGLPDEPRIELELWFGKEKWSTGFWQFDIADNPAWGRIRKQVAAIVDDLSGGKVLQIDP